MYSKLSDDKRRISNILESVCHRAIDFYNGLDKRSVAVTPHRKEIHNLSEQGVGAEGAMEVFFERYSSGLSASTGSRYLGFVVGGATPASVAGDWLVSVFDQNATLVDDSIAPVVELETLHMARQLLDLPDCFSGSFVTGATMANFVGLAIARQWAGQRCGIDIAEAGLTALKDLALLSATPHSSTYKAVAMLGLGRANLELLPCLANREAIDVNALEARLAVLASKAVVVIASAGTVNTVDFDDLRAIVALKSRYDFWLHVDAAFGAFAACSDSYSHLVDGLDGADSITVDFHKWLNVPYDSAIQLTKHGDLQKKVFCNSGAYLGHRKTEVPNFINLTPENSRRFRALPAWMSLLAYGKAGHREIVERDCQLARLLGDHLTEQTEFKLLAPVRLNVVCFSFTVAEKSASRAQVDLFLDRLTQDGVVFLTSTTYGGAPAIRAAFSNWRTSISDVERAFESISRVHKELF